MSIKINKGFSEYTEPFKMLPIHSFDSFRLFIVLSRFIFRILIAETKDETLSDTLPPICDETEDMRFIE